MIKSAVFAIATCLLSETAAAAPVYLECAYGSDGDRQAFSVALDEQNRKVTHTWASGTAFNAEGFFAANAVSYKNTAIISHSGNSVRVTQQFEIDRSTLALVQTFILEPLDKTLGVPSKRGTDNGKCSRVKPAKRQF